MLNRDSKLLIILFLFLIQSCIEKSDQKTLHDAIQQASIKIIDNQETIKIYKNACDSIDIWSLNKLGLYTFKKGEFEYELDSLLCFNTTGERFITCILEKEVIRQSDNDGLIFFYGEKINSVWYFFRGAAIVLPREYYQKDIHTPLSFEKMHEIALKEIYGGYLKKNIEGMYEINDAWVNAHFEGTDWGIYKTKGRLDTIKLRGVKAKWVPENFKPVKREEIQTVYDPKKRSITISFPLRAVDSIFFPPTSVKVLYSNSTDQKVFTLCNGLKNEDQEPVNYPKQKMFSFEDKDINPNDTYYYQVMVLYDGGYVKSGRSDSVIVKTGKVLP